MRIKKLSIHLLHTTTALAAGMLVWSSVSISESHAQDSNVQDTTGSQQDTYLAADAVRYDQNGDVVTATGSVEISQGETVLRAEQVSYNQLTGVVTASENVILTDETGNVLFAETVELQDNLSKGFIESVRMLMADNARAAAANAVRIDGKRTEMNYAVYSPCEVCEETPTPLWQLKAVKVIHDAEEKTVEYNNAWLEFYGIPFLYTPYFSHPDPSVRRKSGFLIPDAGNSSSYGFWTKTPYFWALSEDKDITLTPYMTSADGPILLAEYREVVVNGDLTVKSSAAYQEKSPSISSNEGKLLRGHLDIDAHFFPDDVWSLGLEAAHTTDDTFLRRYDILGDDRLESRAYMEGISDRNYAAVSGYYWQGLLEDDDPGETPLALPLMQYTLYTPTTEFGSRLKIDADAAALTTDDVANSYRFTGSAQWRLPYTGPMGDVYGLEVALRGDAYYVDNKPGSNAVKNSDGFAGRFRPYVSFDWSFPLDKQYGTVRHLVEPFANAFVTTNGGNPENVPNLDSTTFEFDDTNLVAENRYPGFDRVGGGSRIAYGLKTGIYGVKGGYSELVAGQSLRLSENLEYPTGSGAEEKTSDYVGRLTLQPHSYFNLQNRFRLDGESLSSQRNETTMSMGPDWLRLNLSYASIEANSSESNSEAREQLSFSTRYQMTETWHTSVDNARDLTDGGGNLYWNWNLGYEDECFVFTLQARRSYQQDRDIKPTTTYGIQLSLKTLG